MNIMATYQLCPSATVNVSASGRPGQVLVSLPKAKKVIDKVFIRAVNPDGKKSESKMFTLRNIHTM